MKQSRHYPKLSRLQKAILVLALKRHKKGLRLFNRDVLVSFYGFHFDVGTWDVHGSGQVFNVQAIGEGRYRAASVAVSKSFKRLHNRGLVKHYWGVELTSTGRSLARKLLATPTRECRKSQIYM
jgi:hypothetical protein